MKAKICIIAFALAYLLFPVLPSLAATYTYDDLNRLIMVDYGNGQKINYTYDAGGNLLSVQASGQPAPDTTPPAVENTDPANNASSIPVDKAITVTFSEDIQAGEAYDFITLNNAAGGTVSVTKNIGGRVLTIKPNASLACSTTYTVTIPAGAVQDAAGNGLAGDYAFSFTTAATHKKAVPRYVYFQSGSDMVVVDYARAVNDAMNDDNTLYNAVKQYVGEAEESGAPVIVETDTQKVLDYQKALGAGKRFTEIINDPGYQVSRPEAQKELRVENGRAVIVDM